MKTSAITSRGPANVRRLARGLGGIALSGVSVAGGGRRRGVGLDAGGFPASAPIRSRELAVRQASAQWPSGRRGVLGASGSVITDALGPYEVFARSPRFFVYTVSAGRPIAMLSGGLASVPDYSLEDVDTGSAPAPDLVVIPAVAAPNGNKEAPLREWITRQADRGAQILSVCAGSELLATTGLLDGRRATSHWSKLSGLQRSRRQVDWVRGQRYVQDGNITTTAGVTSGVFGALRLVEQLAGAGEAQRVGRELAYPGWSLRGPTEIRARRWAPRDLAYLLAVVFPWFRPTVGVGLVEGVGELEVAAPFEVYASSFAAGTVPVAAEPSVITRHGLRLVATPANAGAPRLDRLVVPGADSAQEVDPRLLGWAADHGLNIELPNGGQPAGEFSFDAMLRDLAGHCDRVTARVTAESIEYPTEQPELAGAGWPWRPTALLALTATAAIGVALVPAAATRRNRR